MKLTRKEMVILEMESKDFDTLMFFLQRGETKTLLEDIDAQKADDMYYSLREMNKA